MYSILEAIGDRRWWRITKWGAPTAPREMHEAMRAVASLVGTDAARAALWADPKLLLARRHTAPLAWEALVSHLPEY